MNRIQHEPIQLKPIQQEPIQQEPIRVVRHSVSISFSRTPPSLTRFRRMRTSVYSKWREPRISRRNKSQMLQIRVDELETLVRALTSQIEVLQKKKEDETAHSRIIEPPIPLLLLPHVSSPISPEGSLHASPHDVSPYATPPPPASPRVKAPSILLPMKGVPSVPSPVLLLPIKGTSHTKSTHSPNSPEMMTMYDIVPFSDSDTKQQSNPFPKGHAWWYTWA